MKPLASTSSSVTDWKALAQGLARQWWTTHGQARWQSLNARERLWLSALLGLMGVWLFVSIGISPALRTLNSAERQRTEIDQQAALMRTLQQRAQDLQKTKPLSREESLRNLQNITPTGNPALQMTIQGDRVLVQLKNLSASQLATWLAQARSNAQALPDEVHMTRSNTNSAQTVSGLNTTTGVNTSSSSSSTTATWDGQIVLRLPLRQASYANGSSSSISISISSPSSSANANANANGARP